LLKLQQTLEIRELTIARRETTLAGLERRVKELLAPTISSGNDAAGPAN
jgi:hypothetical protein